VNFKKTSRARVIDLNASRTGVVKLISRFSGEVDITWHCGKTITYNRTLLIGEGDYYLFRTNIN
jgi:hypothetical protein